MPSNDEIRQFLFNTIQNGYANPNVSVEKFEDGSHLITHEEAAWKFNDVYYGGDPFSGQGVIFYLSKAIWAMQYRGWIHDTKRSTIEVYDFLRLALQEAPSSDPYRGPHEYKLESLIYRNSWDGDIANFSGSEVIIENEQAIYNGLYFGGIVDK